MDTRTLSRWAAVAALIVAPAAMLVSGFLTPVGDTDGVSATDQLSKVAAHQGPMRTVLALDLAALFIVPAIIALARLGRRGAPGLALAGGWLAGIGWLAGLVGLLPQDALLYEGARLPDRAGAAALVHGVEGNALVGGLTLLFVLGHVVGGVLLGCALWRSRAVSLTAALLVGISPLVHLASHIAGSTAVDDVAGVLMVAGFALCAVRIAALRDDDWDLAATAPVRTAVPAEAAAVRS